MDVFRSQRRNDVFLYAQVLTDQMRVDKLATVAATAAARSARRRRRHAAVTSYGIMDVSRSCSCYYMACLRLNVYPVYSITVTLNSCLISLHHFRTAELKAVVGQ